MAAEGVDAETGEVAESPFPRVVIPTRFVIQQQGRDFVLSDGLLDGLHQLSRGFFEVETKIEQLPTAENGQTAVVSAVVTVFAPYDGRVLRRASDIGDASPASVGRNIAPHLIRMASTRATSRALRTLLNEGSVAYEELGGPEEAPQTRQDARPASFSAPAVRGPAESIQVAGRTLNRAQVLEVYDARLAQAAEADLQLAPMGAPGGPPPRTAPLPEIVAFCQAILRRLDARSGAVHASAK